jgi:tRNA pseudouridine32 synthase / 23S rRNA pseudouridine746 synthase
VTDAFCVRPIPRASLHVQILRVCSTRRARLPVTTLLHADGALLAADKPAGLATIPERDPSADCLVARLRAEHGPLLVVHRLDKDASGVVVFARTPAAHRALCMQFEARTVSKSYVALVHGEVAGEAGRIEAPLRSFGSGRTGVDHAAGKPSTTTWRVLERRPGLTLLELQPLTGRRHQLRAHLHALGHPIAGDTRYGNACSRDGRGAAAFPRLMLHARLLTLDHPVSGERLVLRAEPPEELRARRDHESAGRNDESGG